MGVQVVISITECIKKGPFLRDLFSRKYDFVI